MTDRQTWSNVEMLSHLKICKKSLSVEEEPSLTLIDKGTVSSPSSSELSYPQPGPQWRSSCDTSSKFCAAWGGRGAAWAVLHHVRSTRYQCNPGNCENSIFSFSHFDGFSVEENLLKVKVDFIKFQEHFLSFPMKYFYFPFIYYRKNFITLISKIVCSFLSGFYIYDILSVQNHSRD